MPSLLNRPTTSFFFLRLGTQLIKWLNPLILALYLLVILTMCTFYTIYSHLEVISLCSPPMIFDILPYLLSIGEAETGSQVSRRLKAINRMTVNMNAAIILKLYYSTMSRTLSMLKHICNKVASKVLSLSFQI